MKTRIEAESRNKMKNSDNRLFIRVDANHILGIGHVMRCKPIADEWIHKGGKCVFLTADQESSDVIEGMGFECVCLHGEWQNLEKETGNLLEFLQKEKVGRLLIDSYYITREYMQQVSQYTKVIYLGPMQEAAEPADMLLNYTITADREEYAKRYRPEVKKLIGCRYFPLRREFRSIQTAVREEADNLFLATGGSDPCHVALCLAKAFLKEKDYDLHLVVGAFNEDKEALKELQLGNPRLHLYENVKNMAEVMAKCDVAVSAGGITLYELCSCGVPTITYAFVDNQLPAVKKFAEENIMETAGDIRTVSEMEWVELIVGLVGKLCRNREEREKQAARMKTLVDGQGVDRILDAILLCTDE